MEAAGTVLEVLSVSFGTLQKAVCWKAKGARSEQLMQVESGGSCRDGFGGAILQFRNPTTSCGWKGARSEQLVQVAPKAKLHTQGGPRRRPGLARARQGRRIFPGMDLPRKFKKMNGHLRINLWPRTWPEEPWPCHVAPAAAEPSAPATAERRCRQRCQPKHLA